MTRFLHHRGSRSGARRSRFEEFWNKMHLRKTKEKNRFEKKKKKKKKKTPLPPPPPTTRRNECARGADKRDRRATTSRVEEERRHPRCGEAMRTTPRGTMRKMPIKIPLHLDSIKTINNNNNNNSITVLRSGTSPRRRQLEEQGLERVVLPLLAARVVT